jgi:tetratricopeptide (TPR) repeat protein
LLLVFLLIALPACEDYVNNVDPFIDRVVDSELNSPGQIPLLRIGLINQAYQSLDYVLLMSDGLSDALIWDQRLAGATYAGFRQLEETVLNDLNGETNGSYYDVQQTRVLADTLIYRVNSVSLSDQVKNDALYAAYFWGAYARYLLGTYWGKDENTGGATVNVGRFEPTSVLYADAIGRWKESLKYTAKALDVKVVNSFIARCYFFLGDYANAVTYLNQGLAKGDAPFVSTYMPVPSAAENAYRAQASDELRIQWRVDARFQGYTTADATEANRIKLRNYRTTTMLEQRMYIATSTTVSSPIPLIDWQEVSLMTAELIVRGATTGDALALINDVRTSHTVKAIAAGTPVVLRGPTASQVGIYEERDKELFLRGLRLVDQRRFDSFHVSYGWKYFPTPLVEKVKNPDWNK